MLVIRAYITSQVGVLSFRDEINIHLPTDNQPEPLGRSHAHDDDGPTLPLHLHHCCQGSTLIPTTQVDSILLLSL